MSYGQTTRTGAKPQRPDPIESPRFGGITKAQVNYIEILSNNLSLSHASRNAHILGIIGHTFMDDIHMLTKAEGSAVISKFKEWDGE